MPILSQSGGKRAKGNFSRWGIMQTGKEAIGQAKTKRQFVKIVLLAFCLGKSASYLDTLTLNKLVPEWCLMPDIDSRIRLP